MHSCWAVSDSVASSSNLRLSTTVDARLIPSAQWAKPQAWNSGAAIIVFSRARSGITDSSAAIGSIVFGIERDAPFGVPVVPEVRMIALPCSAGASSGDVSPRVDQVLEVRVARRRRSARPCSACDARRRRLSTSANSWS